MHVLEKTPLEKKIWIEKSIIIIIPLQATLRTLGGGGGGGGTPYFWYNAFVVVVVAAFVVEAD